MHRLFILAALATVSATPPPPAPAPADPLAFFTGRTEGTGTMKILFRSAHQLHVHGSGTMQGDGSILVEQIVRSEGEKPVKRQWRIRQTTPGRYAGTLSDARGPIAGESVGDRFRLNYRTTSGYTVEQWITFAPDGRSARNLLSAKKLGVVVARLDETIRKLD